MIKIFLPGARGLGQNHHVWEDNWAEADLDLAIQSAADDYLSRVFRRYFPRNGLILEGGCGLGQYVAYYRREGYNIVGIDFATSTVRKLKEIRPDLPVQVGDVTKLPFADDSVDCYYSGGVVEHFEEGPQKPLKEAWRVLKPGGRLLITVPYVNTIRRWRHRSKDPHPHDGGLKKWADWFGREPPPSPEFSFSEYQMTRREFRACLEQAGFRIERMRPVDLLWGEIGQWLLRRRGGRARGDRVRAAPATRTSPTSQAKSFAGRMARDLLVRENTRQVPLGPTLRILNRISGHMVLAVATPEGKGR